MFVSRPQVKQTTRNGQKIKGGHQSTYQLMVGTCYLVVPFFNQDTVAELSVHAAMIKINNTIIFNVSKLHSGV